MGVIFNPTCHPSLRIRRGEIFRIRPRPNSDPIQKTSGPDPIPKIRPQRYQHFFSDFLIFYTIHTCSALERIWLHKGILGPDRPLVLRRICSNWKPEPDPQLYCQRSGSIYTPKCQEIYDTASEYSCKNARKCWTRKCIIN